MENEDCFNLDHCDTCRQVPQALAGIQEALELLRGARCGDCRHPKLAIAEYFARRAGQEIASVIYEAVTPDGGFARDVTPCFSERERAGDVNPLILGTPQGRALAVYDTNGSRPHYVRHLGGGYAQATDSPGNYVYSPGGHLYDTTCNETPEIRVPEGERGFHELLNRNVITDQAIHDICWPGERQNVRQALFTPPSDFNNSSGGLQVEPPTPPGRSISENALSQYGPRNMADVLRSASGGALNNTQRNNQGCISTKDLQGQDPIDNSPIDLAEIQKFIRENTPKGGFPRRNKTPINQGEAQDYRRYAQSTNHPLSNPNSPIMMPPNAAGNVPSDVNGNQNRTLCFPDNNEVVNPISPGGVQFPAPLPRRRKQFPSPIPPVMNSVIPQPPPFPGQPGTSQAFNGGRPRVPQQCWQDPSYADAGAHWHNRQGQWTLDVPPRGQGPTHCSNMVMPPHSDYMTTEQLRNIAGSNFAPVPVTRVPLSPIIESPPLVIPPPVTASSPFRPPPMPVSAPIPQCPQCGHPFEVDIIGQSQNAPVIVPTEFNVIVNDNLYVEVKFLDPNVFNPGNNKLKCPNCQRCLQPQISAAPVGHGCQVQVDLIGI